MATSLLFIDRINVLCRYLINGKNFDLKSTRSYEVKLLPSLTRRGIQQNPLLSLHAIKHVATVAVPPVSARGGGRRLVEQERSWAVEYTRSNLG